MNFNWEELKREHTGDGDESYDPPEESEPWTVKEEGGQDFMIMEMAINGMSDLVRSGTELVAAMIHGDLELAKLRHKIAADVYTVWRKWRDLSTKYNAESNKRIVDDAVGDDVSGGE